MQTLPHDPATTPYDVKQNRIHSAVMFNKEIDEYADIPYDTMYALMAWQLYGDHPGNFVWKCLDNRATAILDADNKNKAHFEAIIRFIYNRMSSKCWNSKFAEDWSSWKGTNDDPTK